MKRGLSWSVGAGALALGARAQALDVTTLRDAGPAERRHNVVVLGDGYRVEDQAQLASDAEALVNYLFGVSPLQQYAQFFNVKLVHVISNEAGGDNGNFGALRDTALGASFDCFGPGQGFGSQSLICLNDGAAFSVALEHVPEMDLLLVLVNDTKVGAGGGSLLVSSAAPASFESVAHELGHRLGDLADENEAANAFPACNAASDCFEANVTLRTIREQVKWNAWLEAATPVPTPETGTYAGVVGVFEGARYETFGIYRPAQNCKMRELGQPYCAVCSEQLVRSIWSGGKLRVIESFVPEAELSIGDCAVAEFQITSPVIVPSTYRHTWTVDGVEQAESDASLELDPATLGAGAHEVRVRVEDATALVRSDPEGLLDAEQVWTISVSPDACAGSGGSNDAGVVPDAGSEGGAPNAGAGGAPNAGASSGADHSAGVAGQDDGDGGAETAGAGDGGGLDGALSGSAGVASSGTGAALAPPSRSGGCSCAVVADRRIRVSALLGLALGLACLRRWSRRSCTRGARR
jgi:hypothetical protein